MLNIFGQGVQYRSRVICLLNICLLFTALYIPSIAYAEPGAKITSYSVSDNRIIIIHPSANKFYEKMAQKLSRLFADTDEKHFSQQKSSSPELIIILGIEAAKDADKHYPESSKLFIVTDPGVYIPSEDSAKNNSVLYMAQPYCRQIQFISLLNSNWKVISILNSQNKPVDISSLEQCALEFGMKTRIFNSQGSQQLTSELTDALRHSDVLLALPDSQIYNSTTVKNILLTSYRLRKPIIGFSSNFVNAGALASLQSNVDQIVEAIGKLVNQYQDKGGQFAKQANYPSSFDISINRQVFMALDLSIPDTGKIKQSLMQQTADAPGESK